VGWGFEQSVGFEHSESRVCASAACCHSCDPSCKAGQCVPSRACAACCDPSCMASGKRVPNGIWQACAEW
jgi:hypothetical protein